ncbi:TspO/MBR family protein [Salidesulfovibrio brasiliensis]|uniref:TspO/MBR family protein n=1 Tax=Salidesulfovibrio brasiliensis TaxID=221711 RepID=UPI0006D0C70F|nr:TspO/MBR family protein [Salidesulfovibrio brasiliensis]
MDSRHRRKSKGVALLTGLALAHVLAGSMAGAFFPPGPWVEQLVKPAFYPPNWAFPVVWTALYALMGISLGLILQSPKRTRTAAITFHATQLAVNLSFTPLMFGLKSTFLGMLVTATLLPLVILTILAFRSHSTLAAWLQIPYALWTTFALMLATSLWQLNG